MLRPTLQLVKDAADVISKVVEDVVLQKILAMQVKEIVMDLLTVVAMMDMLDVREISSVEAITANSLEATSIPRMIVVKIPLLDLLLRKRLSDLSPRVGVNGNLSASALRGVEEGLTQEINTAQDPLALIQLKPKPNPATQNLARNRQPC